MDGILLCAREFVNVSDVLEGIPTDRDCGNTDEVI